MLKKDKNKPYEFNSDLSALDIPKTAVIGVSGFLGSAFLAAYRHAYPDCIGATRKREGNNIFPLDLLTPNIAPIHLAETQHKEALIFAGISKISKCETEKQLTRRVNIDGTLELIRQLVSEGIKPIFASSDYVFDGNTGNYLDDSPTYPITEYGFQKAEVERRIGEVSNGDYLVIRLSKIFSLRKEDETLLDEMAHVLSLEKTLRAAYDQIFCPTLLSDLIRIVANLQMYRTTGIVNVCSPEVWSRYDLALEIAKAMKVNTKRVSQISLDEFGFELKRPKNTSMKIDRLLRETQCTFTPTVKCIGRVADNWREEQHGR